MGKHVVNLLVAKDDLDDGLSLVLERDVVAVDIGRQEDFWSEMLAHVQVEGWSSRDIPGFQAKPWLEER